MTQNNVFISALGLPGCGKTTIMKEVASILGTDYFFAEPEEKEWGEAVKEREHVGYFSGLMWFRSNRVPNLIKAESLFKLGYNVVIDSYYDKAISSYIAKEGMEWLIDKNDPYFELAKEITKIDWYELPNVTHLITLNIEKKIWLRNLNKRNRNLDSNKNLLNSFNTQQYFYEAANKLSKEFNIKHIPIEVENFSVNEIAQTIVNRLELERVQSNERVHNL